MKKTLFASLLTTALTTSIAFAAPTAQRGCPVVDQLHQPGDLQALQCRWDSANSDTGNELQVKIDPKTLKAHGGSARIVVNCSLNTVGYITYTALHKNFLGSGNKPLVLSDNDRTAQGGLIYQEYNGYDHGNIDFYAQKNDQTSTKPLIMNCMVAWFKTDKK